MSCCDTQINAHRNSDLRFKYTPVGFTFANYAPRMSIRSGGVEVFAVTTIPTVNGSVFETHGNDMWLTVAKGDIAALAAGTPVNDSLTLHYDITVTDQAGLISWLFGSSFTVLGIDDTGGCGCEGSAEINLGGYCLNVEIQGGLTGIITDAPYDGLIYGRKDGTWVEVEGGGGSSGIPDAPIDGNVYGRKDAAWALINLAMYLTDAPSDGDQYVRQDGAWEVVDIPPSIPDAPSDGVLYGREDGAWEPVVIPPPAAPVPFTIGCNVNPPLDNAEVLFTYVFTEAVTFPANLSGSTSYVIANPSAATTYLIKKNGTLCANVAVSTGGVVTLTTVGGAAVSFVSGDRMSFEADAVSDPACACSVTLKGAR